MGIYRRSDYFLFFFDIFFPPTQYPLHLSSRGIESFLFIFNQLLEISRESLNKTKAWVFEDERKFKTKSGALFS